MRTFSQTWFRSVSILDEQNSNGWKKALSMTDRFYVIFRQNFVEHQILHSIACTYDIATPQMYFSTGISLQTLNCYTLIQNMPRISAKVQCLCMGQNKYLPWKSGTLTAGKKIQYLPTYRLITMEMFFQWTWKQHRSYGSNILHTSCSSLEMKQRTCRRSFSHLK